MLSKFKGVTPKLLKPITSKLVKLGIKPNHITVLSLISGIFAFVLISLKYLYLGALFVLLSGFFDMLDGALARSYNLVSDFGAFLDSVVDRYVDVLIFISLGIYGIDWLLITVAMSGALLVSYTRARAENIIEKCDVGIAERGERLIILFAGIVTGFIYESILIVAVLSHITALHRIIYTFRESRR